MFGVAKGGELPINRIPTRPGESSTVYRAPLKSLDTQIKEKLAAFNEWRAKWIAGL